MKRNGKQLKFLFKVHTAFRKHTGNSKFGTSKENLAGTFPLKVDITTVEHSVYNLGISCAIHVPWNHRHWLAKKGIDRCNSL